jgi:hypothetical protein
MRTRGAAKRNSNEIDDVEDTLSDQDVRLNGACKRRSRTATTRTVPSKYRAAEDVSDIESDPDFAEDVSDCDSSCSEASAEDSDHAAGDLADAAAAADDCAAAADLSR